MSIEITKDGKVRLEGELEAGAARNRTAHRDLADMENRKCKCCGAKWGAEPVRVTDEDMARADQHRADLMGADKDREEMVGAAKERQDKVDDLVWEHLTKDMDLPRGDKE